MGAPDPALAAAGESAPRYAYQLASLPATLWAGVQDGSLIGHSRLFDGAVDYADEALELELPRYYEADRFSGPLGDDRGISPFAVDFEFDEGPLGALLFDPAQRWNEVLDLPEGWSLVYIAHPFRQPR